MNSVLDNDSVFQYFFNQVRSFTMRLRDGKRCARVVGAPNGIPRLIRGSLVDLIVIFFVTGCVLSVRDYVAINVTQPVMKVEYVRVEDS